MTEPWNLKDQLLQAINQNGGFVNCHGHFDKAFYITKEDLAASMVDMEKKWHMSDELKRRSTPEEVMTRVRTALDKMIAQNVKLAATFIDAYEAAGHKHIDAANIVKKEYAEKIKLITISQPLGGLLEEKYRKLYEEITDKCDLAGGLPSKDRPYDNKNFDILFSVAKNLNKRLHIHIDQENNPHERDTEKVIYFTKKYGYEGRVTIVHAVSLSAQDKNYRREMYREIAATGISIIVCPSAALSMRQLEHEAPLHNSIANVPEMLEAGITIGIGTDNIADFYQPFVDGDMWTEMRLLMESCRYYDFDNLLKIATENGRKIFNY